MMCADDPARRHGWGLAAHALRSARPIDHRLLAMAARLQAGANLPGVPSQRVPLRHLVIRERDLDRREFRRLLPNPSPIVEPVPVVQVGEDRFWAIAQAENLRAWQLADVDPDLVIVPVAILPYPR